MGCYFHYIKTLWNKARKLGLTKKKLLKDTIVLTFSFKLDQFMKDDDKTNFLNEIKKIYSKQKQYKPFIDYFIKNWSTSNFLDFEGLEQENILERTDNAC